MKNDRTTSATRYLTVPGTLWVLSALLALLTVQMERSQVRAAQPSAQCSGTLTPSQGEGPYYKAGSPERASLLEPGMKGTKLVVTGYVFDKACTPIARAWLDFWQADAEGRYDNAGYTLRGHQYTDASGRYRLETVAPAEYPGRPPHIHVKVRAQEGGPTLTSQLYFPDAVGNRSDSLFNQALVMQVQDTADGKVGTFSFVLNVTAPQPPAQPPQGSGDSYTFRETGFTVSGDVWRAWQGGLPQRGPRTYEESLYINGLPLTSLRDEVSPTDGKTYKTQWFERARFELHPENQAPNNVLLGLLGAAAAQGRQNEAPFRPVSDPGGGVRWFAQTRHTLGDSSEGGRAIASFWTRLGGLSQFGYPLSQPFMETSKDDGKRYLVQYFERQRFEYHPENKATRFEVLLGRLGAEQVNRRTGSVVTLTTQQIKAHMCGADE